ncbi:MAG: glycosyltransferase, partial [Bacteroidetes bacterium]|nr:glycosyltransferase [Bacteroidota bacterium]
MKRIIVSVTNDLVTDQRVNKTCLTLSNAGYDILLVGRKLKHSLPLEQKPYKMHRMKLRFTKGPFFYAAYNLRLFFFLMTHKADVFFSNDLDTLLANYLAAKIKGKKLVYDTHEYYCYVPELICRPKVQKVWLFIERYIFPKLKWIFTVNDSIAGLYKSHYQIEPVVVRNVPMKKTFDSIPFKSKAALGLPEDKNIILLQGAGININRGAEEAVLAMQWVENAIFLIIGGGDVLPELKKMVKELGLGQKVIFKPKMPFADMI